MAALAGGLVALVLGIIGISIWWSYFLKALAAGVPIMLILGGALAVGSTVGQSFLFAAIFLGQSFQVTWDKIVQQGHKFFGQRLSLGWIIVLLLLLINLTIGALGGELAWEVGQNARRRLSRRWEENT